MLSLNHGYGLTLNSVYNESIWSPLCKSNIIINLKCLVHILQRSMDQPSFVYDYKTCLLQDPHYGEAQADHKGYIIGRSQLGFPYNFHYHSMTPKFQICYVLLNHTD